MQPLRERFAALGFDRHGPPRPGGRRRQRGRGGAADRPGSPAGGRVPHLSATSLWNEAGLLAHEDVLVCGDDAGAKAVAVEPARTVTGRAGVDAGALRPARQLEPLTAVLIGVNKRDKVRSGVRVAGLGPGG
ncbi:hypothetical protein [Streptomyces sp. TP-A0875]|uniref:hypothetical protein n=1 Tax=Streptomyces sp. TP-A0875 TaxID=552354 RepID=UPI0018FEC21D|nr:hypothetical protein [Streptomyces sp. TP-A0875]